MRDRFIELLRQAEFAYLDFSKLHPYEKSLTDFTVDYLLENGVIVTPCVAMVEQFIKDGVFDEKIAEHNGKYAVVYVDKTKWKIPLIDITEQAYNAEKAEERINALKARERV